MAAVSSYEFHLSKRIRNLAEPKKIKNVWNYSRRLVWGNQETIRPLSHKALIFHANTRILDLAKPKKKFDRKLQNRPLNVYSCGRESEPSLNVYDCRPSERILHLSEPKQYSSIYLERRPRSSPLWPVSPSALSCKASQRLMDLSQPRALNFSIVPLKEPKTVVSLAAQSAEASPRTRCLSQPVIRKSILCYDNRYLEAPIRKVTPAALRAVASPRIAELSRPKPLPAMSSPARDAEWPVSSVARKAVASQRIAELAQCPPRASTNIVQFNPEAFTVKEKAMKAFCTDRIRRLAVPIVR